MTAETTDPQFVIEPFDPDKHDRAVFSCGVVQVDNYFKKTANKLAKANNTRVWVLLSANGDVIGFYSINAHAVDYNNLPAQFARTRPAHDHIPAAYISMIGVDRRFAGHRYGDLLLADALSRLASAADNLGIAVVLLDVLDCGDPALLEKRKKLYISHGFIPLPSNELRMFLPMATIQDLLQGA